ncbi:MAG: phenylacetate--CoA ligase family protein [Betaproteobacteria bacterium]|nr:MAG: phenylacetate--CoA ligase family protein [Betaproteobacteria bacterium]
MPVSDLLYAPREAIEAERERCFAEMMDLAAARHPRTRARMAASGLARADFASLADLARLPPTLKSEYMADPDAFRLDAEGLPQEMRTVWDVMYTTGTSAGRPTPFVSTTYDFFRILETNRNMLRLRGVRPEDVIANLFPLTAVPHGAFIRALHAAASMNLRVVAALPGNPSPYFTLGTDIDGVVRIVARSEATILWGVPSFVRRVVARAAEMGADFSAVRLAFVTGEGVTEAAREELTAALRRLGRPDAWVSVSYGSTEMQGGMVECAPGSGLHNPAPGQFYMEVVDPKTYAPVGDGNPGLLLLTHLRRRGTVLLRYALGDVSVLSRERCPHCGSWTDRLVAMPRRSDALLKIKGTLVNPDVLAQAAEAVLGAREFQFVVEEAGFTLKVAGEPDNDLTRTAVEAVKRASGVTPALLFVTPGDFISSWKLKRVVDLRG